MTRRAAPWWLLLLLPAIAGTFLHASYYLQLFGTIGIDAIAAVGLALTLRKAGQASLAQTTFMAVGAYTCAMLELNLHWPLLIAGIVGVAAAAGSAYVVGAILLNLEGLYFALGTLALNAAAIALLSNSGLFGNASGLEDLPAIHIPGLSSDQAPTVIIWIFAALGLWLATSLDVARFGRGLRMLRESAKVTQSVGFNPASLKRNAFALSGAYAGVAGVLLGAQLSVVNPSLFSLVNSISLLAMVIVGGESLIAAVGGAIIIVVVHEITSNVLQNLPSVPLSLIGGIGIIVNGMLLIVILRFWPRGLTSLGALWARPRATAADFAGVVPASPAPLTIAKGTQVVAARGISHRFGGVYAVEGASLTVAAGEILAVIGPNGAGKTTLLTVLGGFHPLQTGEIDIAGHAVDMLAPFRRARLGVAATFQHMEVVEQMSVRENVLASGTHHAAIAPALAAVGLLDHIDTPVSELSFGQQRMVELARVLARDTTPRVLLMDEPASGLSQNERVTLGAVIRSFAAAGTAVVLVEHDVGFVQRLADRILVLVHGVPIAEGAAATLLREQVVIDAYLGSEPVPA
jgi:branched-chain amino acid transport system permease protein